jgi:hypothetical protein
MTKNNESVVITLIDEYQELKEAPLVSEKEREEARRIIHEIMLMGRTHAIKKTIKD